MKLLRNSARLAVATLMLSLVVPASASVDCTGTVTNLSLQLDTSGTVTLSLAGGPTYTYLCNVAAGSMRNGVAPDVCKTMYGTLMAAKLAGKRVLIRFDSYNSCTAVPAWDNAGALSWDQLLID
jgi:hypothetical protein